MRRIPASLFLLTVVALLSCIPNGQVKRYFDVVPEQLNDGWEIATPEQAGLDTGKVMAAYRTFWDPNAFYGARSLLIVRHGKLVCENYSRDLTNRDTIQHIQSVTKSVTSLVFGICRDQGFFPNLDTLLYDLMPDEFPDDSLKRRITIRHLLTMKSGIAFDNDDYSDDVLKDRPADLASYILARPMYAAPGDSHYYRDCDPELISRVVQRLTGKTLAEIARTGLFEPMGITDELWTPNSDGTSEGSHGLFLTPRDMAKIGQLALQKGAWNGRQLVSEDWIGQSTSSQTPTPPQGPYVTDYGFFWWVLPEQDAFTAWGHGGQYIYVLPEQDMVVVMTSMPSVNDDNVGTTLSKFVPLAQQIADAVIP